MKTVDEIQNIKSNLELLSKIDNNVDKELQLLGKIDKSLSKIDMDYIAVKNLEERFNFMKNAIKNKKYSTALVHLGAIEKRTKPVANDTPFEIGDFVGAIRTEHCYYSDISECVIKITKREQDKNGIWSYEGVQYNTNNMESHDSTTRIEHTRDAIKLEHFKEKYEKLHNIKTKSKKYTM